MYERTSFPRTSKWARHLLRLSNVSNIEPPDEIRQLAKEYSFDPAMFPAHLRWGRREYDAFQYVMDWNGRCVILDQQGASYARHISVLSALELGSKRVMILGANYELLMNYGLILKKLRPYDRITISPSKRGETKRNLAQGKDDAEINWILATFDEAADPAFIGEENPDHIILDVDLRTVNYNLIEYLGGLAQEFMRLTTVAQSVDFWNALSNDFNAHSVILNLENLMSEFLGLNAFYSKIPVNMGTSQKIMQYFRTRGVRVDAATFFEASGVCFDLVADRISKYFKNVFSNNMLNGESGDHSQRRSAIINRYTKAEDEICARMKMSVHSLIDMALAGDSSSRAALDAMKTTEWAKLKSHVFYNLVRESSKNNEKTLIVTRHPEIRKYMSLQLSASVLDAPSGRDHQLARFTYPHPNTKLFGEFKNIKILNTLVVDDIADLDERTLEVIDRVIFTEFPYDRADISDFIDLAKAFRFKLLFATMRGTFEEKLSEELLDPFY